MKNIILGVFIALILVSCEREKEQEQVKPFAKEYSFIKGRWVDASYRSKIIFEFYDSNRVYHEAEFSTSSLTFFGSYSFVSEDTIYIKFEEDDKGTYFYFKMDSIKDQITIGTDYIGDSNYRRSKECNDTCMQDLKEQLIGNWAEVDRNDNSSLVLSFNEDNMLYHIKNSTDTFEKCEYIIYPENYFCRFFYDRLGTKIRGYYNYWLHLDTLTVRENYCKTGGSCYDEMVFYIKQ